MKITAQNVQCFGDAVRAHGPKGDVLLEKRGDGIIARYIGDQLVNGSALAYAESIKKAALQLVQNHPFPWHRDASGTLRIHNHRDFYAQTFEPTLAGIERIKLWNAEPLMTGM